MLPPSVHGRVENVASERNSGKKMTVFDVLRAFSTLGMMKMILILV